jgi:hypothetical protein
MDFLKRLLGGGQSGPGRDKDGMYFYIRNEQTGETVQVRLHRYNDLSLADDGQNYRVRKVIVGEKSFHRLEAEFTFDKNRSLVGCDVEGGQLVDRKAYETYLAERESAG